MTIKDLESKRDELKKQKLEMEKSLKLQKEIKELENEKKPFFKSLNLIGKIFKGGATVANDLGTGAIKAIEKMEQKKPEQPRTISEVRYVNKPKKKRKKKKGKKVKGDVQEVAEIGEGLLDGFDLIPML